MTLVRQEIYQSGRQELLPPLNHSGFNYDQAASFVKDITWSKLGDITVGEALERWLATLGKLTAANYRSGMRKLIEEKRLNIGISLQAFALINHNAIVDSIMIIKEWSECTRQARAACYISFTGWLSRQYEGMVKKAMPSKGGEGTSKTFERVHVRVKTQAMTQSQWIAFLSALEGINSRDCLIAKIILQGGKRVNEGLSLTTDQIDWEKREITFRQLKTKKAIEDTIITYPSSIMDQLREYIGAREGHVFVTASLKPVMITQLAGTFSKAGEKAGISFKVTPHVLRASTVTYLKQQGFSDSDITKVTGHASSQMMNAYDKSSRADNASKKVNLIS